MVKVKNVLLTTTALVGTVTVANSQVAKADVSNALQPATNEVAPKHSAADIKADYDKATKEQAEAQVTADQAKEKLDKGATEVTKAQDDVKKAQQNVTEATNTKAEATPENIAKVQSQITEQGEVIKDKEAILAQADKKVKEAQTKVTDAEPKVDQAQQDVDQAQTTVDQAQQKVDEAQDILNGTNADKLQNDLENAKNEVDQNQQNVTDKQFANQTAKDEHESAKNELESAKTENDQAQADLKDKETNASNTQANLDKANDQVNQAQNKLDELTADNVVNTINMGSDYNKYIDFLYYDENGNIQTDQEKYDKLIEVRHEIGHLNQFQHNPKDEQIMVDPTNLSAEQLRELNLWIVDLLNQIPSQLGYDTHHVVTQQTIDYAKVIADASTSAGFNHSQEALDKGSDYVHGANFQSESIGTSYNKVISLDSLKQHIYNQMISMLFMDEGSNWGHADHLSTNFMQSVGAKEIYFGFAIDGNGTLHFESFIPEDKAFVDQGGILNTPKEDNKEQQIAEAKAQLAQAKDAQTKAQIAHQKASQVLQDAQNKAQTASQKLSEAQQQVAQKEQALNGSFIALQQAQDALKTSQAKLAQAQEAVDNLNADTQAKQAKLDEAKAELETAKQNLADKQQVLAKAKATMASAKQDLAKAQAGLTTAKEDVTTAKNNLAKLQSKLESYRLAGKALEQAQAELDVANEHLEKTKATYAILNDGYEAAKAVLATKQQKVEALKKQYEQLSAREKTEHLLDKVEQTETKTPDSSSTPNVQAKTKGQSNVTNVYHEILTSDQDVQTVSDKQKKVLDKNVAQTTSLEKNSVATVKTLPQTGSRSESWITLLGALLVSALGTLGVVKRRSQLRK